MSAAVESKPAPAGAESGAKGKPAPKPVVLQINTSGAWRNVITFDAADADACGVIEYHAPGVAVVGRAKLRVVTNDGLQTPLRHWSIEQGWRDWGRA